MRTTTLLRLGELREELLTWLTDVACPLWQRQGIDADGGGFEEALGANGQRLGAPRRARVQPRQVHAFIQAAALGWRGDARHIARRGMDSFCTRYRRADGLYRTLASHSGAPLDDQALLYDQAFALLGFAAAATALSGAREYESRALALRDVIAAKLSAPGGGFLSSAAAIEARESNPHMHLLEACLAWAQAGTDPSWHQWSEKLVALALNHMVRSDSGAIGEVYTANWLPAPGAPGERLEPGHLFEWAWLLLRSEGPREPNRRDAALRLIAIGETYGVQDGFAVNALNDDLTVLDGRARLWPQTERLKADCLAAALTGAESYWQSALQATECLMRFLRTPLPGLWIDERLVNGEFPNSPAPASSFYHVVGAIAALDSALTQYASGQE